MTTVAFFFIFLLSYHWSCSSCKKNKIMISCSPTFLPLKHHSPRFPSSPETPLYLLRLFLSSRMEGEAGVRGLMRNIMFPLSLRYANSAVHHTLIHGREWEESEGKHNGRKNGRGENLKRKCDGVLEVADKRMETRKTRKKGR